MKKFIDKVYFKVEAGKGGKGAISFERYKFKPKGKPDGGDGGRGGNIILKVNSNYSELSHLIHYNIIKAQDGENGSSKNKHGKDGKDIIIEVPPGVIIKNKEDGKFIKELIKPGEQFILAYGGKGGKGNSAFKSSTNRSPYFAQQGKEGEKQEIIIELKLLAEIGLIGFPNAGKSTLLKNLTEAKPKISNYPFTTLTPNIGVLYDEFGKHYRVADIPGLIEGASLGKGLGFQYLKHIERTKILAIVIDVSENNYEKKIEIILNELKKYNASLLQKHLLIIGNKIDLVKEPEKIIPNFDYEFIMVSALKKINLHKLKKKLLSLLQY